jgi:Xaa-Pro aminopeptidase
MTVSPIPHLNIFQQRRQRLIDDIRTQSETGIALLGTAGVVPRNRDSEFAYRHDSDFYYLTGFEEPESFLVIQVLKDSATTHLFCRPKNVEREIWDGLRLGPVAAPSVLGVDFAHSIEEINQVVPELMKNFNCVYQRIASSETEDRTMRVWLSELAKGARQGIKRPSQFYDIEALIHERRLIKDELEISLMRQAAKIAALGHLQAMQVSKPGLQEFHLEAELLHQFRKNGSQSVAYNSIVAAGENACILHYRAGNAQLRDGDLCLIDAGCELDSYASDITRTFPINGKFSKAQSEVYAIVLEAQELAIQQCVPGHRFQDPHEAALIVLMRGLIALNIVDASKYPSVEDAVREGAYKPYYMHRTSHWLGMDVHDVGSYREPGDADNAWRILRPGMVLTIEPGLYFRPAEEVPKQYWNIGIRIEDDVLITDRGYEILSRDVPVGIQEIENWMSNKTKQS